MSVTFSSKCYVTVCVGCDALFQTSRRDQMTCSGACRVRAHRNGNMERRKVAAASTRCAPAGIGFAHATDLLCPDLVPRIMSGELDFDDIMPDLNRAFVERLRKAIAMTETAP